MGARARPEDARAGALPKATARFAGLARLPIALCTYYCIRGNTILFIHSMDAIVKLLKQYRFTIIQTNHLLRIAFHLCVQSRGLLDD